MGRARPGIRAVSRFNKEKEMSALEKWMFGFICLALIGLAITGVGAVVERGLPPRQEVIGMWGVVIGSVGMFGAVVMLFLMFVNYSISRKE